jgi:hypothetical protein
MALKKPSPIESILNEHRRRLARVVERGGVRRARDLYDDVVRLVERRLRALGGRSSNQFTAHQLRIFLAQVKQGQALLTLRLAGHLGDLTREAQVEAVRAVSKDIARLERHFRGAEVILPIDEAGRFSGIIHGDSPASLIRKHRMHAAHTELSAKMAVRAADATEQVMSLALLSGRSMGETIDDVMDALGDGRWQAERIVRTESLWAYNSAQADAIEASAEELPDLEMRWTEYIDDATGQRLDLRVAGDSVVMHGQVVPPGSMFIFPNDYADLLDDPKELKACARFVGRSWAHPPMRPNDRSSLIPWRRDWGIPGWRWQDGHRIFL